MGKKNNKSVKIRDHELPVGSAADQNENSTGINYLIGNKSIVTIFLFLISFLVFIPSLGNDFVWDDISYIKSRASKLDFSKIVPAFRPLIVNKEKGSKKYFRPVFKVSLILDNEIWNTSAFGFHLTNIILHSISTVLLYFLVLLLLSEFNVRGRESIALISCILFALYPLHVESVSFISARGDILAAIFFFSCLIFYILSYKRLFYLLLAGLCLFLSLLSKEVAIVLPILILGFDLISRRLMSRNNLIKYTILGLITLFYFYVRSKSFLALWELIGKTSSGISLSFTQIWEISLNTYLYYIGRLVFPYNLNPFIDVIPGGGLFQYIISIMVILAICAVAFVSVKKKENISAFSILWILATLLPAVAVAIFALALTKLADRFMYIPSAGICILFAYILYELGRRFKMRWISFALTAIIALSFAVVTVDAQKFWKNNLTLWEYAVERSPNALASKANYAEALRNAGKPSEALKYFLEVQSNNSGLNVSAKFAVAYRIVLTYLDLANYKNAEKWLEVTLEYDERYLSHYYYLKGFISLGKDDPESAETYFLKSIKERNNAKANYLLGGIYFIKAEREKSLSAYKMAQQYLIESLKSRPRFSRSNILLAKTYLALGDREKARIHAENALRNAGTQDIVNEARSILQMK